MPNSKTLEIQYKPINQKSLFNQKCISEIKRFIKTLSPTKENEKPNVQIQLNKTKVNKKDVNKKGKGKDEAKEDEGKEDGGDKKKDYKKILFLNGPSGCGKHTTVDILFKSYNIINIDSDSIRLSDNINNIINSLASFNSYNLSQFETKPKTSIGNILLIKNAQHCERALNVFIDELYVKANMNIPIIIHCDKQQYRQKFKCDYPVIYIDFCKPSYEDLEQLLIKINNDYKLNILTENMKQVIESSFYDINQFFYIVEFIKRNKHIDIQSFDTFKKDHDVDLHDKLKYIFNFHQEYNFKELDEITYSDSCVISNCIFQNYTQIINFNNTKYIDNTDNTVTLDQLDKLADISDSFCFNYNEDSNIYDVNNMTTNYYNNIFNCILPIYKMNIFKEKHHNILNHNLKDSFSNFKNYSYNYINSLEELKTLTLASNTNIHGSSCDKIFIHTDLNQMYIVFNNIIEYIQNTNIYLDNTHKKRSISNDEYLAIIKQNENMYIQFLHIIDIIWSYSLFETNENINKIKYKEEEITIDIKIFKRYINICSLLNVSKILRISLENAIKNQLKNKVLDMQNNLFVKDNSDSLIDRLTYDLSDIWSCMK